MVKFDNLIKNNLLTWQTWTFYQRKIYFYIIFPKIRITYALEDVFKSVMLWN